MTSKSPAPNPNFVLAIILGHWWIGLIIALIGLIAFGGFARDKWY